QRTWERTLRRAGLPLAYSQGFNPRPKINLATALPLGFTSQCEVADIWLEQDHATTEVEVRLREAVPPGMEILRVEEVDLTAPKLPKLVQSAVYMVTLLESIPAYDVSAQNNGVKPEPHPLRQAQDTASTLAPAVTSAGVRSATQDAELYPKNIKMPLGIEQIPYDLAMRIVRVLGAETLMRERRGKLYDLRPLIEDLHAIDPAPEGWQRIIMRLSARSGATGRPDEVLAVLEIPPHNARVQRTELIFTESKRSAT
ncbi:MAG: TIGR03936 family radical SAM-associated protein, partial [Chloroflexi bacterium]|nr:TIGR03936 family radical SAM-associated protein [Chloroflexota bacterium]